ncbi:MAG: hypothetical protein MSIBF_00375 [Candidatus Altiarchaeales archaeon IMC4]|nr:MAG: hypothetical protein MSIBF_00375 [Candidatus Altiarchaeales archaeon IMC4]
MIHKTTMKKTKLVALAAIFILLASVHMSEYVLATPTFDKFWKEKKMGPAFAAIKFLPINVENFMAEKTVRDILDDLTTTHKDNFIPLLLFEPNPQSPEILNLMHTFIKIIAQFYVVALLLTGAYFIFNSASPSKRSKAKSMLLRLILSMALLTLSVPIFMFIVDVNHFAKNVVLTVGIGNAEGAPLNDYSNNLMDPTIGWLKHTISLCGGWLGTTYWEPTVTIPFFLIMFALLVGPLVILTFRYIALIFLGALFPATIFFSCFEPTRKIGRGIFKVTVMWVFVSFIEAVVLVVWGIAMQAIGAFGMDGCSGSMGLIQASIGMAGAFMLIVAPLMLLGIMNWVAGMGIPIAFFAEPLAAMVAALESIEVENE